MAFEDNPHSNAPYISDVLPSPLGDDDGQLSSDQAKGPLPSSPTTQRKRRPSKGTMPSVVKRSVSTPNVRSMASVESAMSLADKRRNKLGYHRTSVACGTPSLCSLIFRLLYIARPTDQLLFFVQVIAGDAKFDACSTQTIRKEDAQIAYD
jgi:hypothetical protein